MVLVDPLCRLMTGPRGSGWAWQSMMAAERPTR